jgi:hypothetical protein
MIVPGLRSDNCRSAAERAGCEKSSSIDFHKHL